MSKEYTGQNTLTFLISIVSNAIKGLVKNTDARLTDARTPTAHSATHGSGGADPITPESIGAEKAGTAAAMIQEKVGKANGLAPLGADSKINSIYLPGYVDDVLEGYMNEETGFFYSNKELTELVDGEKGKIYVDLLTNITYRYSGSVYVAITSSDMVEIDNETVQEIWDAAQ